MAKRDAGELNAEDTEVEAIIKQACDLIIIVLTGGTNKIGLIDINSSKQNKEVEKKLEGLQNVIHNQTFILVPFTHLQSSHPDKM